MDSSNRVDSTYIFAPAYEVCKKILSLKNNSWVHITPNSSKGARFGAAIANGIQKGLVYTAVGIAALALALFSIFVLPFRCADRKKLETNVDLLRLTPGERNAIKAEIEAYVETHGKALTPKQKTDYTQMIMMSYARSSKVYGPIARAWVEQLLEKANNGNEKLVFLARDGIPQYKIAKKLMATPEYQQKYPNLVGDKKIVMGFISRKVMEFSDKNATNTKLFQDYAENELGIKKGDKCLFVDVGFLGSMIDPIRSKLSDSKINFEYLISMTDRANGFITQINHHLYPPDWAGTNAGTHWLEDTHQGTLRSPQELVQLPNGRIHADSNQPNQRLNHKGAEPGTLDYMIRKFSQRAVVRCYKDAALTKDKLTAAQNKFVETIFAIKNYQLPLFLTHKK